MSDDVLTVLIVVVFFGTIYLVLSLLAFLLDISVSALIQWLFFLVVVPAGAILFITALVQDVRVRINCIRAYWRKAKEACEELKEPAN